MLLPPACRCHRLQFQDDSLYLLHAVLMKHWAIECNHGCHDEIVESVPSGKWHDIGPIDPIKAILIKNE